MRATALSLAEDLHPASDQQKPPVRTEELADASDLLRWLAEDHFTFLGYREYDLRPTTTARRRCAPSPAPAWASCAPTSPMSQSFVQARPGRPRQGPRGPAAGADQGQHPLHRAPPGLPGLRRRQEVRRRGQGGRRAPLPRACSRPRPTPSRCCASRSCGARSPRCWRRRLRPEQPRRQGPAPDPGDLPARRAVPDPDRRAGRDRRSRSLQLQERRRLRLFLRKDAYGRFYSALVYLPARPLHHRRPAADAGDPHAGARTAQRRLHGLRTPSRCWPGCTSWCASPPGTSCPSPTRTPTHRDRLRRRHPLLGRRLRRGAARRAAARSSAAELRAPLRRGASPRRYKARTTRRASAVADLERPRGPEAAGDGHRAVACTSRSAPRPASAGSRSTAIGAPVSLSEVLPVLPAHGRRGRRRAARTSCDGAATSRTSAIYDFGLRCDRPRAERPGRGRPRALPGRVRRGLDRRGRERRLQRPGAARRPDLAPGDRCCAPTPSTCARAASTVQPGLHRGRAARQRRHRPAAGRSCSRPASTRRTQRRAGRELTRAACVEEIDGALDDGRQPGRGPHPALAT